MEKITTIGLDTAKHVVQVHGIISAGATASRRKLRRDDVVGFFKALPPCLIGIEACATGHHWARADGHGSWGNRAEDVPLAPQSAKTNYS